MDRKRKAAVILAVVAVAAGLGALAATQLGVRTGDAVLETAAKFQVAPAGAPGLAPALDGAVPYADSLPEPEGGVVARQPSSSGASPLASGAKPQGLPVESEASASAKASGAGECALGTRAVGSCDCLDEAHSKLTLRLHPTQACVDEEAQRLGHQVVLQPEAGHFELAGNVPEAAHAEASAGAEVAGGAPGAVGGGVPSGASEEAQARQMMASVAPNFFFSASHCGYRGHTAHVASRSGLVHIRDGLSLPPLLARAIAFVGQGYSVNVTVEGNEVVFRSGRSVLFREAVSSVFRFEDYIGKPGFDDGAQANAYAMSLMPQYRAPASGGGRAMRLAPSAPGGQVLPGPAPAPFFPFGPAKPLPKPKGKK